MNDATYQDRQEFEMGHWPELRETWNQMIQLVFPEREVSGELKQLVFTVASLASGCRHCQSHGAYHLHKIGVPDDKIQALWSFETSDLFTDAEQIIEILAVIAVGGYLNRWNDTIATVTDQESIDYADRVLRQVGWDPGKHVGEAEEQRKAHPITLGWSKK